MKTAQTTTTRTLQQTKTSVKQKEQKLEEYDNQTLKALIQDVKKKVKQKYGAYQGVFSITHGNQANQPDQEDLNRVKLKVAAENILQNRGEL